MSERLEKYYTPEQREELAQRRRTLGEERIRQAEAEWQELMEQVHAEMDRGTDPADARVQALARRWTDKVHECTGGDPGIEQNLKRLWEEQGDSLAAQFGAEYDSRPVWGYISRAVEAMRGPA